MKAYFQLFRLPNVFTAAADVLLGFLFTHATLEPVLVLGSLVTSSCLLYTAGMVLNDVFDLEVDRRERPHRPIPSRRIPLATARWLGFELLVAGAAFSWMAGYFAGSVRPGLVATILAVLVWSYDAVLKQTPAGPMAMGSCRALNVLLGMSAAGAWHTAHWLIAAAIGTYIVGVTWFARTEAHTSRRAGLIGGLAVMIGGIALLACFPAVVNSGLAEVSRPLSDDPTRWRLLLLILAAVIGYRCIRAIIEPVPQRVQAAVKLSIMSLIVIDATACAAVRELPWPLLILALLLPTMTLGRWIYST